MDAEPVDISWLLSVGAKAAHAVHEDRYELDAMLPVFVRWKPSEPECLFLSDGRTELLAIQSAETVTRDDVRAFADAVGIRLRGARSYKCGCAAVRSDNIKAFCPEHHATLADEDQKREGE